MRARIRSNPLLRLLFMGLGLLSLAVGLVGVAVPLVPTTGPVLLAAFLFSLSSDRLHGWIVGHKRFGPLVRDYQAGLGIPLRAKVLAVVMIAITFGISLTFATDSLPVRLLLVATAVGVVAFILTRPTRLPDTAQSSRRGASTMPSGSA